MDFAASVRRVETTPPWVNDFGADYWDCFAISGPGESALEWARLSLRGAEASGGIFSRVVWHGVLGFELTAPNTPGTVVGWWITDSSPTSLVLDTDGRMMAGRMVFQTSEAGATWTTMVRYHHPLARPVWQIAAHAHRALVPRCLMGARRALNRGIGLHS
jgi:hypothetical protein